MKNDSSKESHSEIIEKYKKRITELEREKLQLEHELVESRKIYKHVSNIIKNNPVNPVKVDDTSDNFSIIEALYQSEERCALILETTKDGIYDWDISLNSVYCSPNWYRMFGYRPDEFPVNAALWTRMIHSDDRRNALELWYSHINGRTNLYECDYRVRIKNGGWKWVHDRGKVIKHDSKGKPLRMAGTVIDISCRKAAEEEIRLNEERISALFEISQMYNNTEHEILNKALDTFIRVTKSKIGYVALVNEEQTELRMFAWSKEALDICRVENKEVIFDIKETGLWGEPFRQRKPIITNDYNLPNPFKKGAPEGHVPLARHMGIPVIDDGYIALLAGVGNKEEEYTDKDIRNGTIVLETAWHLIQRKRAEEALKSSESDYKALYNYAHDAIVIFTPDEKIIEVNQRACEIYKMSREEFVGSSYEAFTKDVQRGKKKIQELIANGFLQNYETIHYRSDGSEIFLDTNASVIKYKGVKAIISINRDISKRKAAENAMKQSEEKYKSLAEQIPVGIYRTDLNGKILYCNPAFSHILGYNSPDEMILSPISDYYLDPEIRDDYFQSATHEDKFIFEIQLKKQNGDIIWVLDTGRVSQNANGENIFIDGIIEDINDRRNTRIQLKNMLKMQEIAENISTHFLKAGSEEFDTEITRTLEIIGSIAKADHCYLYLFKNGIHNQNIVREWTSKGVYPINTMFNNIQLDNLLWIKNEFQERKLIRIDDFESLPEIAKQEFRLFVETSIKSLIAVPIFIKGKMCGYFGVSTERNNRMWSSEDTMLIKLMGEILSHAYHRKNIEAELKDSEEWLRRIVENMNEGLIVADKNDSITFVNKKFMEMAGMSESELVGRFYNSLFDDAGLHYLKTELQKRKFGYEDAYQIRFSDKNGKMQYLNASPKIIYDTDGSFNGSFAVISDITKLKETEDELKESLLQLQNSNIIIENQLLSLKKLNSDLEFSEARLQKLNADKDKLFSIIAHDLRSPIAGFIGISHTLMMEYAELTNEEIREMSFVMHNSAEHLFKLLENLLEWSRIQRGIVDFQPDIFQIRDIFYGNLSLLSTISSQKNITINNNVSGDLIVKADYKMLNTIIRNLLSNAIKFSFQDGIIDINALKSDNKIKVYIRDSGIGIDNETENKLFNIDSTVSRLGTDNEHGSGLGLILCKELAEINEGSIEIVRNPDAGVTAILTLNEGIMD